MEETVVVNHCALWSRLQTTASFCAPAVLIDFFNSGQHFECITTFAAFSIAGKTLQLLKVSFHTNAVLHLALTEPGNGGEPLEPPGPELKEEMRCSRHAYLAVITVAEPSTLPHSAIIAPDSRANHQHRDLISITAR